MPYIKAEIIDKIFEATDTLTVLQGYIKLSKKGANWMGLSPFTDEKSGSFSYNPAKGIWKCFSCGKSGSSAVSFLMQKETLTYPQALEVLASKFGITVEYEDGERAKEVAMLEERRTDLRPVLMSTINAFEKAYAELPEKHPARLEVESKRDYNAQIIDRYSIGYAPGGDFIYKKCVEAGKVEEAHALGIIDKENKRDKWVDRVIYPLMERKGSSLFPVGLAGRTISDNKKYAKWTNSADSELYNKSKYWYGLESARESIVKTGEAWIVEGYNDVIAAHRCEVPNTIASSGTAIAIGQIKILSKLCKKVILCFDQDPAGIKSMIKYIPVFLKEGFRVQLVNLGKGIDPDDFVRKYNLKNRKHVLARMSHNNKYRKDGFGYLMTAMLKGKDEVEVISEAKKLSIIIKALDDEGMRILYSRWLQKESKLTLTQVKEWLKNEPVLDKKNLLKLQPTNDEYYTLPKKVKIPLAELRPIIEKYQCFMANNQVWMQSQSEEPPFTFRSVSNFSIEIIQHMNDDKFPSKLVRVKNTRNENKVFDVRSSEMNQPMSFENAVTNHGNFRWKGNRKDHETLKTYLFDNMGVGRKIDVLGWQSEGFWVWNNRITVPGKDPIEIDQNGVFDFDNTCYYVPSANSIYKNNRVKYEAQKKAICLSSSQNFNAITSQMLKVHRDHAIIATLFCVASVFQDIVVDEIDAFPLLFLYGPASSGKDQLADCVKSFFGKPQTAINLEGNASTVKAKIREFAQFSNMISELSEYKPGNADLDGVLKGLWGREGYKRGNIESMFGTESIPITSAAIITGNFAPDQEALITRKIWVNMIRTVFSDEETKEFEKLNDMIKKGISGITETFIHQRDNVVKNFKHKQRAFKSVLGERAPEANSRMLTNLSVLGAFYQLFQDVDNVMFPFSHTQMMDHFEKTLEMQMNKMTSASIIVRWWDCFLVSMRGNVSAQLRHGRDFKLEGDILYYNFTSCYSRISQQWYIQYKDTVPSKGVMMDALKKDSSWLGNKAAIRFAPGALSKSTSAYLGSLNHIDVSDEIKFSVDFQNHESSFFPSPATPDKNSEFEKKDTELPF